MHNYIVWVLPEYLRGCKCTSLCLANLVHLFLVETDNITLYLKWDYEKLILYAYSSLADLRISVIDREVLWIAFKVHGVGRTRGMFDGVWSDCIDSYNPQLRLPWEYYPPWRLPLNKCKVSWCTGKATGPQV